MKKTLIYNILDICNHIGSLILSILSGLGRAIIFIKQIISATATKTLELNLIYQQFLIIGFYSLPIVGFTAIFSGAVLALQSYVGFSRFAAEASIPNVIVLSITRELGPVLAGLMVAGRTGSSIAAEIGTMRVTEQIDALQMLGVNPLKQLVVPRIIAGFLMLPCLVFIADVIGIWGGYLVSVYKLNFNGANYIINTLKYLEYMDVISGLIKASVFGGIITTVGCYCGYNCTKGARGVGRAVISAVVQSSIMILLFNYILTELFFSR
jgi:phospholipid/cholesterol/gamma-HCH transport system permease protein